MKVIIVTDNTDGNFCGVYSKMSKIPKHYKKDESYRCDELEVDKPL